MSKINYIFLLGRPGCGKSIVFREMAKMLKEKGYDFDFRKFDDFPFLKEMHDEDEKNKRYDRFVPTSDGGFKVIDSNVWDELLKKLNEEILENSSDGGLYAVEFSRPNYVHSLKLFSKEILERSIAIYIDASFECCVKRNEERTRRAKEEGIDAHFVSRKEMEETYLKDDRDELKENSPIPVFFVKNDFETTVEEIKEQVKPIVFEILERK